MRILHVNKFLWRKGGAEICAEETALRQARLGHDVALFGGSAPSEDEPHQTNVHEFASGLPKFCTPINSFHQKRDPISKIQVAAQTLWSPRAAQDLCEVVEVFRPEVVHLHNYSHQLTSSILPAARSRGASVLATAHDYKLICPAYVAVRRGQDCFACTQSVSPLLIKDRCHHDSFSWSLMVMLESKVSRRKHLLPDGVISPSRYMHDRLGESWMADHLPRYHVRNAVDAPGYSWRGRGKYLLYVGRLSREKGVSAIIASCAELDLPLVVAGDGPLRAQLESESRTFQADVTYVGHLAQDDLNELRRDCVAQVVPSQWPENAPLSAVEAAVAGVPLIMVKRGGLLELRQMGARAAYVNTFDADSLRAALVELQTPANMVSYVRHAFSWDVHLDALMRIYKFHLNRKETTK